MLYPLVPPKKQKEPKLSRARQIPEWEQYDGEIAQFARKLAKEGLIKSDIATADANVLASTGSGSTSKADVDEDTDGVHKDGEQGEETINRNSVADKLESESDETPSPTPHVKDEL